MRTWTISSALWTGLVIAGAAACSGAEADVPDVATLARPLSAAGHSAPRISGDFNGDHRADVLIVTGAGMYEYLGQAGSGFVQNVWIRNDLTLGSVDYF